MSHATHCPRCNRPLQPHAAACAACGTPLQAPQPDIRFNVVRKGEPFAAAAAAVAPPVSAGLPDDVLSIGESAKVWYCRIGGQIIGPVTADEIRRAFSKGRIDGQASVGIQGKQEWFPIRSLPQFSGILTGVGPAPTSRPTPAAFPAQAPVRLPQPAPVAPPRLSRSPAVQPLQVGTPSPESDRDDKTEVVPPLPPPGQMPGAQYSTPIPSRDLLPPHAALMDEVKRLRRLAIFLGVLVGIFFVATAALLGLLAAG